MKRPIAFAVLAVAAAAVLGTPTMPARAASSSPITVQQCFVVQPKPLSKNAGGVQIDFTNVSKKTATEITWAVGYRNAQSSFLRKVTDDGTFTPNTPIAKKYDLYNDVTYAGKKVQSCAAVSVKFSDGSKWSI